MPFEKQQAIEDKSSKINAAGLINSTLEKLWLEAYTGMANGNYLLWNSKLDAIWIILGGDEPSNGKREEEILQLDLKIYGAGDFKSKVGTGFSKKSNENNSTQYIYLKQKSLFLRRLQNKQGKGTAYASDDEDDF